MHPLISKQRRSEEATDFLFVPVPSADSKGSKYVEKTYENDPYRKLVSSGLAEGEIVKGRTWGEKGKKREKGENERKV